jgi:hypothetical protein
MEASISIVHGDETAEIRSLTQWLRQEDMDAAISLAGAPAPGEMGVDAETIRAVIESGTAAAALITSIGAWLNTRRQVKLRVEGPKGVIDLESARTGADLDRLLEDVGRKTGLVPGDAAT